MYHTVRRLRLTRFNYAVQSTPDSIREGNQERPRPSLLYTKQKACQLFRVAEALVSWCSLGPGRVKHGGMPSSRIKFVPI